MNRHRTNALFTVAALLAAAPLSADTVQVTPPQQGSPTTGYSAPLLTSDGEWIVYSRYNPSSSPYLIGLYAQRRDEIGTVDATEVSLESLLEPSIADGLSAVTFRNGPADSVVVIIDPLGENREHLFINDLLLAEPTIDSVLSSRWPEITPDGTKVVFSANVTFTDEDDWDYIPGLSQVFLFDLQTRTFEVVSRQPGAGEVADNDCLYPTISDDGSKVAFVSPADNLAGASLGYDLLLKSRTTGAVSRIGNANSDFPTINRPTMCGSGAVVAFVSTDPAHGASDAAPALVRCPGDSVITTLHPNDSFVKPALSFTGSKIAFYSFRPDLAPGDANLGQDAFLWCADPPTGQPAIRRVSVKSDGSDAQAGGYADTLDITASGDWVAFSYSSQDITPTSEYTVEEIFLGDGLGLAAPEDTLGGPDDSEAAPPALVGSVTSPGTPQFEPGARVGLPIYHVHVGTLDLLLKGNLFSMPTRGPDLAVNLKVSYNGSSTHDGTLGRKWRFLYDSSCSTSSGYARLERGSGQVVEFASPVDLTQPLPVSPVDLIPPPGFRESAQATDTEITFTKLENLTTWVYDRTLEAGRAWLTEIRDRNGNVITISRDPSNPLQIDYVEDAAGRRVNFQYNNSTDNLLTSMGVPGGRTVQFTYDVPDRLLTRITDMAGHQAQYVYDNDANLTRMQSGTGAEARITNFGYLPRSAGGTGFRIATTNDRDLGVISYTPLDGPVRRVRRTSRGERPFTYTLDADYRLTGLENPTGGSRSIEYVDGLPCLLTDAVGNTVELAFNDFGFTKEKRSPLGEVSTYEYETGTGFITRHTLPSSGGPGPAWNFAYDGSMNLLSTTSPEGRVTSFTYDSHGDLTSVTEPGAAGNPTTYTYDTYGNIATMTNPEDSAPTVYEYDAQGLRCTRITDPRGKVRTFTYDGNDRLLTATYGNNPASDPKVTLTWDAFNQKTLTDELGHTVTMDHNLFGLPLSLTAPLGNTTSSSYDVDNRLRSSTDPLGRSTTYEYDDAGYLVATRHPVGTETRTYDADGRMTGHVSPSGASTTFTYDGNGSLLTADLPGAAPIARTYDAQQRQTSVTNGRGQVTTHAYDNDSRLTSRNVAGRGLQQFTYDARGNLLTAASPGWGTTSYTYDFNNRLTGIQFPNPFGGTLNMGFVYTGTGELEQIDYPDGTSVSVTWTDRSDAILPNHLRNAWQREAPRGQGGSRPASLTWGSHQISFTYDNASRLSTETRSNGTTTSYAYDNNARVLGVEHANSGGVFAGMTYTYLADDSTATRTTTGLPSLALAPADEETAFNVDNQIVLGPGADSSFAYDADGNMTAGLNGTFSATYTADNLLASVTRDGVTTTYEYDASNHLVRRVRGGVATRYFRNPDGLLLFETDDTGAVTAINIHHEELLVARGTAASGFTFYHFDRNGNTLALTGDTDAPFATYNYLPYGSVVSSGSPAGNPYTYVGARGVRDEGNGLLHMKRRFYDIPTGRFLQLDPRGLEGGANLYAYGNGNPVDLIDPHGGIAFLPVAYPVALAIIGGLGIEMAWNAQEERLEGHVKKAEAVGEKYNAEKITKDANLQEFSNRKRLKDVLGVAAGAANDYKNDVDYTGALSPKVKGAANKLTGNAIENIEKAAAKVDEAKKQAESWSEWFWGSSEESDSGGEE